MLNLRNYALVTSAYWGFTLTDGALRMLVLLHFHDLGYTPVHLAFLFLLYEFCGILTNLFGGWIGSQVGLKATLFAGLALQEVALVMLSFVQPGWVECLSVGYVMVSQALSGVAKDLTKMSSKSAVKLLVKEDEEETKPSSLFKWVAILTGSKNALKGLGFFLGGLLLGGLGFKPALWAMAGALGLVLLVSRLLLKQDMGKSKARIKFKQILSKRREINLLSLARFFLFGSRDVWFVVGLPVFRGAELGGPARWLASGGVCRAPLVVRTAGGFSRPGLGDSCGLPSDPEHPHRVGPVRDCLCRQLFRALLPDSRLHRYRPGCLERWILLHGQRLRPSGGYPVVGGYVLEGRFGRLPVDLNRLRPSGGLDHPISSRSEPA
jgi:hypothetical protein